ncbi:MAG: sulfotransferase domain-containing protein [Myxococcales bacterium]|nr:sulfotransferase domain-containing protein [Myxococcales bacterium]
MIPCTWIATYPKSGTTWVRFIVHNLLVGPPETSADLSRSVPSIHETNDQWRRVLDSGGVLNTHKHFAHHVERYPRIRGFVHVVRHPADVFLSEARFFCLTQADGVARIEGGVDQARLNKLFQDYLTVMVHHGESHKHRQLGLGTWGSHAQSWLAQRERFPSLLLRYEDLVADTAAGVRQLAAFFDKEVDESEVERIVQRCSAQSLRAMQEREIVARTTGRFYEPQFDSAYRLGLRFVGKAQVGGGMQLGDDALRKIEAMFGDVMGTLGYTRDGVITRETSEDPTPGAAPRTTAVG